MPLAAADLATLGDTPITILSAFYPNIYLRMDGTGVTAGMGSGGGRVNCEYGVDAMAKFRVRAQANGSYAFESVAVPNVFLRMDGTGVPATGAGGGTVNCQYGLGPLATYNARAQANGSFSFESVAFPGIFLRLVTGSGVTTATGPGGTVNCQVNANGGANETFVLGMGDQNIAFVMQHQEQTNWCWDAATVSVAKYYEPASTWTQCGLANITFTRNDCCVVAGQASPCNWGQWPDGPLRTVKHLNQIVNNALTPVQLGAQIAKSAPVLCNIAWPGGGGHIVGLRGRSLVNGVEHVSVGDPWTGDADWTYSAFQNNYANAGGIWNVSYETQP
ncbi:MAG: hypothetical protein JF587_10590 [Catenulisporales bacterium]|jgi:hypothetical protein|nr:hypothetical protein [Catenulisporales bacterium]